MEFEGRSRIQEELSMAPLIDVVFLLLLFFILTSTFRKPEAIDLKLPSSKTATRADDRIVEVAIASGGQVFLGDETVALDDLAEAVRQLLGGDPAQPIAFKTDAEVSVQRMLEVVDEIRRGGGRNLAFMTERATASPRNRTASSGSPDGAAISAPVGVRPPASIHPPASAGAASAVAEP